MQQLFFFLLAILSSPKNLTVRLLDFKATAEWLPGQGNPPDTRYTLEFITAQKMYIQTFAKKSTNKKILSDLSNRFLKIVVLIFWVGLEGSGIMLNTALTQKYWNANWLLMSNLMSFTGTILWGSRQHLKERAPTGQLHQSLSSHMETVSSRLSELM